MCKMLRLWNSRDNETVSVYEHMQGMESVKQSGPWNSLGAHGSLMVMWWLCISSWVKPKNLTFKSYLTLEVNVNYPPPPPPTPHPTPTPPTPTPTPPHPPPHPQNNRDLNQGILHLWSKFGDPSLNGCWILMRTNSKWGKFGFQVKFGLEGQSHLVH